MTVLENAAPPCSGNETHLAGRWKTCTGNAPSQWTHPASNLAAAGMKIPLADALPAHTKASGPSIAIPILLVCIPR